MGTQPVALVTGASSGIGEATARALAAQGFVVHGAARRVDRMQGLVQAGIKVVPLDVTDDDSMVAAVGGIVEEQGRIDLLVNNAGYGSYGALEDVPMAEARAQMEVNVFGAARLMQLVLPHMREAGSGRIVNVTSMGGRLTTPLGAWYHATKYALEALSDATRMEVREFGIDVAIVEPGGVRTEWGGIAARKLREASAGGAYEAQAAQVADALSSERTARFSSDPSLIARTIVEAATAEHPRARYAVGFGAKPLIALHDVLPTRAFDAVIRRSTGLR